MMIGMSFSAFIVNLVVSFIAAIILHSAIRYRMLEGFDGFMAKWVAGWIGAWVGPAVFGHWWFRISGVSVIPALISAFALAFAMTVTFKAQARAAAVPKAPASMPAVELRKAS